MNEARQIGQSILVYAGSAVTITLAWFDPGTVSMLKDAVAILVGLATLVYTVLKIKAQLQKNRSSK